jgi:glycosyltransferase involved in cell wall biosynthesis
VRSGYKNFANFLKAVSNSPRLMRTFKIAAFGGGAFAPSELAWMEALGFEPGQVVQFSGADALLGRFYRQARALVYPSRYEGFGIPPLEAMARACPVICSNASSIPEVVGSAGAFFSPDSVDDIQSTLESVVFSDSHTESLKALGSERIRQFSWARCAEETRAVYRTLT